MLKVSWESPSHIRPPARLTAAARAQSSMRLARIESMPPMDRRKASRSSMQPPAAPAVALRGSSIQAGGYSLKKKKTKAGTRAFSAKLANWDMYLAPVATRVVPLPAHTLMMIAGVAEIVAGLIVAVAPRIGGWIVAVWLWLIIINLLVAAGFYDTALRDFGLSLAAVALARLGAGFECARQVQPATQSPMASIPGKP